MIKLLHTGDIHLDSAFSGLDSRSAEIRRNELRSAFTSMITYARMNNADLIIIAGDLFDSEYVTKETISILRREFESFAEIGKVPYSESLVMIVTMIVTVIEDLIVGVACGIALTLILKGIEKLIAKKKQQ